MSHIILFTLLHKGQEYPVQVSRGQYYSLMTLISDYLALPGFGLCSGMGSCGTCMVDIKEKNSRVIRSGLSCDIQVNDELANVFVVVPDRVY